MRYEISEISIEKLIELSNSDRLDLSPPYQRNEVWSTNSKKLLIDSVVRNYPLPNFFIRKKEGGIWEMVDGQQRTRAILGFYNQEFPTIEKINYNKNDFPKFLNYKLAIIFISNLEKDESIEDFYSRVNSTGMKLNRPELRKSEYFKTRFLKLLQDLAADPAFTELALFTESSLNRMNDIDFVSELIALLKFGVTDKKDAVDTIFEEDISKEEYANLKERFMDLMNTIYMFNTIYPIKKTRYKQRNDFYTVFQFLNENRKLHHDLLINFYDTLILIDGDISPSNDFCLPFKEYALNCVSQSNSKQARENRIKFLDQLFLNNDKKINDTQEQVLSYYKLQPKDVKRLHGIILIDARKLQEIVEFPQIVT